MGQLRHYSPRRPALPDAMSLKFTFYLLVLLSQLRPWLLTSTSVIAVAAELVSTSKVWLLWSNIYNLKGVTFLKHKKELVFIFTSHYHIRKSKFLGAFQDFPFTSDHSLFPSLGTHCIFARPASSHVPFPSNTFDYSLCVSPHMPPQEDLCLAYASPNVIILPSFPLYQ